MFANTFAPQSSLRNSSRLPVISRAAGISIAELACLAACGAFAALAVGLLHLQLRVPGHAILRGAFPMAMGLALVPRRGGGMSMAIAAGITATVMSAARVGIFPATSMLSVLALGPILDLALLGPSTGWKLYARFAAAGAIANLLGFGLKLAGLRIGIETGGGGGNGGGGGGGGARFLEFGTFTLLSFLICGALAGLIGAAAWFRTRANHDLRRD